MSEKTDSLLTQWNRSNHHRHRLRQIILQLSLLVILVVFWSLKLTGIGIAGEAFCGKEEHMHSSDCVGCTLEEHTHVPGCYSNINADLETEDDWEMTLSDMVRGPTTKANVILVARSQLGYTESTLNFQVDVNGVRRGITRYGQWYGNPYGDWSAMFVSFCLEYGGAADLPMNAGAESMRVEWEAEGLYQTAAEGVPEAGNILFLRSGDAMRADAVAVITEVDGTTVTVIQGDLENAVKETRYELHDPAILGYGIVPAADGITVLDTASVIAKKVNYDTSLFTGDNLFVVYTTNGADAYAFDGNGNAVPITVDAGGNISTDSADPDSLLWSFTRSGTAYLIKNLKTGRYMHAFSGNGASVTTTGAYTSVPVVSGSGIRIRSNSDYAKLNPQAGVFQVTQNQSEAAVYSLGMTSRCTVWLDGTDGGLGHLTGSPDTGYTVYEGDILRLPTEWTSPSKYSYKLRGWYDVTNSRYYAPGADMKVTGNAVLYADWVAATYDIGQFNAQVADTVSTNSFITTHMFDYNYLFNVHSARAQVTVDASGHSETWSMISSGNVPFGNRPTLDFIFVDNDSGGLLCIPNNRSNHNIYPGEGVVTPGIYTSALGDLLFSTDNLYDPVTGTGVVGKNYLGTGDHLFQIMDDPGDEHYGYYYYDSKRNAASYNQSRGRFYVYDYLSATSDAIGGSYSDFLPLNSPYVNTNGKTVGSYHYDGVDGEYAGIPHYRYDSKYNSGDYNSPNNVQADYAYGMRSDIRFYLPNVPGIGGNKDLYGNDMQFQFSGDDDLWVLIDGIPVLDIGGIHGAESGMIDFSTGVITVQGEQTGTLMDLGIGAGDHTMTILYLERGSSLSNCSIYFNLAPRFSLQLQKEDVLTRELLNGTRFSVYEDLACTLPVALWESEEAYHLDMQDGIPDQAKNTFTVKDGVATLWGLGSGNTYYIKETGPPSAEGYGLARGIIRLTLEKKGVTTYHVDVIDEADGTKPSGGFTVHGIHIDEATKTMYVTVTNAPETVTEVTTVQVVKHWQDTKDHSRDYITVYLTVTDPDGTVRRIREITLSDENQWMYVWTNLPKYDYDALTEVRYGIEESYESGYYSTVRKVTELQITSTKWAEALTFQNGQTYVLWTANGYLSTRNNDADTGYTWVDMDTAVSSPNALWTATVINGKVKLTNGVGQTITFYYGGGSPTDFYARIGAPGSNDRQEFSYSNRNGGLQFYYQQGWNSYYLANSMNGSGKFGYSTNANNSLIFKPYTKITTTTTVEAGDWAYQITNTPLAADNETSLSVSKNWVLPEGYSSKLYEEFAVTVRLMANGMDTGRSITLTLKNNWQGVFQGLPYKDASGNVIVYTVTEVWEKDLWVSSYGAIQSSGGSPPTYSTVITNTYHPGGPELPSTGSFARLAYTLCGAGIMLVALAYGIGSGRKKERRMQ